MIYGSLDIPSIETKPQKDCVESMAPILDTIIKLAMLRSDVIEADVAILERRPMYNQQYRSWENIEANAV